MKKKKKNPRTRCYEVETIKIMQQKQTKLIGSLEDEVETISQKMKFGD